MYFEAHLGCVRPPWYMHTGDQIIALLFSCADRAVSVSPAIVL